MNFRFPAMTPLTGRHVLIILVCFFLGIFLVNGVFVYFSLRSHPGVTSDDAYRQGLEYNRTLDHGEALRARGWKPDIVVSDGHVELSLTDAAGKPVRGLTVQAHIRRPVHDRADRTIDLSERAPGRYAARQLPLAPGRWAVVFTATAAGQAPYRLEYEAQVKE